MLETFLLLDLAGGASFGLWALGSRRLEAVPRYRLLRLCLVFWLVPLGGAASRLARQLGIPALTASMSRQTLQSGQRVVVPSLAGGGTGAASGQPVDLERLLLLIWAVGLLICLFRHGLALLRLREELLRHSRPWDDTGALAVLERCRRELGVRRPVALLVNPKAASPYAAGILRPTVTLPKDARDHQELDLIFRHELTHIRRGDLLLRQISSLIALLHWYDPLVYLFQRAFQETGEAACDALVILDRPPAERRAYGQLLLRLAGPSLESVTTPFSQKAHLERRLLLMLNAKRSSLSKRLLTLLLACLMLTLGIGATALASGGGQPVSDTAEDLAVDLPTGPEIQDTRPFVPAPPTADDPVTDEAGLPEVMPNNVNLGETIVLSKGDSKTYSFNVDGGLFSQDHNTVSVVIDHISGGSYQYLSENVSTGRVLADLEFSGSTTRTISNISPSHTIEVTIINLDAEDLELDISITSYIS